MSKYINSTWNSVTVFTDKSIKLYRSLLKSSCKKPVDVTFLFRWGSLPLLSARNATIPQGYIFNNVTNQYRVDLQTNGSLVHLNITNPMPGDWYAIAYINQVNDKISQKGLERECYRTFASTLKLNQTREVMTLPIATKYGSLHQSLVFESPTNETELLYKFYVGAKHNSSHDGVKIIIKHCRFVPAPTNGRHSGSSQSGHQTSHSSGNQLVDQWNSLMNSSTCSLLVNYRILGLPSVHQHDHSHRCQPNVTISNQNLNQVHLNKQVDKCIIDLPFHSPNEWNYLQIVPIIPKQLLTSSQYSTTVTNQQRQPPQVWNNNNLQQQQQTNRSKHQHYGSINFTIQILVGKDAFLYSYYNEEQCLNATVTGIVSANNLETSQNINQNNGNNNPSMPYPNYGKRTNEPPTGPLHEHFQPTTVSSTAASETLSTSPSSVVPTTVGESSSMTTVLPISVTVHPTKPRMEVVGKPIQNPVTATPTVMTHLEDDYDQEEEDNFRGEDADRMLSHRKRRQDPNQNQQQQKERKSKADRKKEKEERRLKKLRQKTRQKSKERAQDLCDFDPSKVLQGLDEDDLSNMTTFSVFNLTRYQYNDLFEFRYSHLDVSNFVNQPNSTQFFDVENDRPSLANFTIVPQFDTGGSLTIEFAISPQTDNIFQNVSALLCLTHNRVPTFVHSMTNAHMEQLCTGLLISNTSTLDYSTNGSLATLVVPYPQPGTWFISMLVRCYTDDDVMDELGPMLHNPLDFGTTCDHVNYTSILLNIQSTGCANHRCLNGGKCLQYLNAGILYSTCSCRAGKLQGEFLFTQFRSITNFPGWKGLVCNDGTEALSEQKLLINFVLLTVSNVAFIPAILVALFRRYYTESVVYFLTMTFSAVCVGRAIVSMNNDHFPLVHSAVPRL